MTHHLFFRIGCVVIGLLLGVQSPQAETGGTSAPGLADRVIQHTLANGLTVLLVERHQSPVVSINMTFGVGGINEHNGATGLAHLYEHMQMGWSNYSITIPRRCIWEQPTSRCCLGHHRARTSTNRITAARFPWDVCRSAL